MLTLYGEANEVEERVARAICNSYSRLKDGWNRLTPEQQKLEVDAAWDMWLDEAKAAIAAVQINP